MLHACWLLTQTVILASDDCALQDCGHEEELQFLRQRNEALENENVALMGESRELRARVDALVMDLSIKEAKWCETEEALKMKASEMPCLVMKSVIPCQVIKSVIPCLVINSVISVLVIKSVIPCLVMKSVMPCLVI